MATYASYTPSSLISKALFNFDALGGTNYVLTGTIRVSVSDAFSYADYVAPGLSINPSFYTFGSNEIPWSAQMTSNLQETLGIFSQFANLSFQWVGDFDTAALGGDDTPNPANVGAAGVSDVNVTWIYRSDVPYSGFSGANDDRIGGYSGAAGDVYLNAYTPGFGGDYSLGLNTTARQILMHELGHSLGLSHPHSDYVDGVPTITADYAATQSLGFDQLGFQIDSAQDMYREYFTIMSYDDQASFVYGVGPGNAHTPMILDVLALQQAYGEGEGTTGTGNDTIIAGTLGYRTYFDKGGVDTIDLSLYSTGAYLHLGAAIAGSTHLVGVAMSFADGYDTIFLGGDPAHLRWLLGEYENASGSSQTDLIVGNALDNALAGRAGDDFVLGDVGSDSIDGGDGNDSLDGGEGNDRFDWDPDQRSGNDTMSGGPGDDVYVIDSLADVIVEADGEGADTVFAPFTYSLAGLPAVESLVLFGSQNVNATGNSLANLIQGNDGANVLSAGLGGDVLQGRGGDDILTFSEDVAGAGSAINAGSPGAAGTGQTVSLAGKSISLDQFSGGDGIDGIVMGPGQGALFLDSGGSVSARIEGVEIIEAGDGDDLVDLTSPRFALSAVEIRGGNGDDVLWASSGNDTLNGGPGRDALDGGAGTDMAAYAGAASQYTTMRSAGGTLAVGHNGAGADGVDALSGIEVLSFADRGVAAAQVPSALAYIASYADLIGAFGANDAAGLSHYLNYGYAEGRRVSFDGLSYVASYGDLITALGANADAGASHYISYGRNEGRTVCFDGLAYIASYADLIAAYGADGKSGTEHYINWGHAESRQTTFDGLAYIASYADLINAFGANAYAGAQHYLAYGRNEGRGVSFSGLEYIASYGDLINAFGANAHTGADHYVRYGYGEGRTVTFGGLEYIASYGDLIQAFGANGNAGASHYIQYGLNEGRTEHFNAVQYLTNYADLQAAFGSDTHLATLHYIQYGYAEGRTDAPAG